MNKGTKPADILDGLSNTIGFAEVKAYQPYVRNTTTPTALNEPPPAFLEQLMFLPTFRELVSAEIVAVAFIVLRTW